MLLKSIGGAGSEALLDEAPQKSKALFCDPISRRPAESGLLSRILPAKTCAMSRNQNKRLTGRWVVVGFLSLIGVTVLAAVLGFFRAKDPRGEILAMAAVDGESAALFREI